MSAPELTDGEIERMRESLRAPLTEPKAAQVWAEQARQDLDRLLEVFESERAGAGSSFAAAVRQALEGKIIRQVNGQAHLTSDTKEVSLVVSVTPQAVFADIRLQIGRWSQ